MYFFNLLKKKFIAVLAGLLIVTTCLAQDAANAQKTETSGNNQLAILLLITTIVLAFVIWGLGQVLVILGRQTLNKSKDASKALVLLVLTTLLFTTNTASAQDAAKEVVKVLPNYGGLSPTTFYFFVIVIAIEIIAILFLSFLIRRFNSELLPQKEKVTGKQNKFSAWWSGLDKKIFTKAVPVEKEADVMLDHDYDGIHELDNALPPWWKYGFYFTIVVGFIYLLNFHVFGTGKNPTQEYAAEMEKARIDKENFEAQNKDKIDENNVPLADAAGIVAGQRIYEADCVACHIKGGGGSQNPVSIGPNLTDDYWIHKGSLNDIYLSIKNGYPDKGMQSWITKYNPKEISLVASYIKSIRGTKPPGAKAPQGELFSENNTAVSKTDSGKAVLPDTSLAKKTSVVIQKDSVTNVIKK